MLTDAAIKRLRMPATGQRDVSDGADVKGLVVRLSSKARVFYLAYRTPGHGKQARIRIGEYPEISLDEARDKGRAYRRLLEHGIDPRQHERQIAERKAREESEALLESEKREKHSFARVAEGFLAHCEMAGHRALGERRRHFDKYIPADWQERQVTDLTRDDMRALLHAIETENGAVMANRVLESVRSMFYWFMDQHGQLAANPAAKIKSARPEVKRDRVLSDLELSAVWKGCDQLGEPFRSYVRVLALTAQRRREVATMRWRDIDMETGIWEIPRETTKMDRAHQVPLLDQTLEILNALPRYAAGGDDAYVFTTTGGKRPISGFSKMKSKLDEAIATAAAKKEAAKVVPWRLHDLRRTAASGMARLGIPPHVCERVLGHEGEALSDVARVYNRYSYSDEKRSALQAWANHVTAITDDTGKVVSLRRGA
jgi:integrase